jgi:hypothetical protein
MPRTIPEKNQQGATMTHEKEVLEKAYSEHIGDHYRRASEELLHAYQRNKEAARHHEAGAFKAALHHAKLSKHHSFNAHEHLKEALNISEKMGNQDGLPKSPTNPSGGSLLQ